MILKNFQIFSDINKPISIDLRYKETGNNSPVIFVLHGFKAFKDWGFFPYVCKSLTEAEAITVCFNFSMNGILGNSGIIDKPEDFAENTISRQVLDFEQIVEKFLSLDIPEFNEVKEYWNGELYALGHSIGGAIALLTASNNNEIKKLASWGTIAKFDRYTERQKTIWREKGFLEFINKRTGQTLRMNKSYLDDFEKNPDQFDLLTAAQKIRIPYLLVHGSEDLTVRLPEPEQLAEAYSKKNNPHLFMKIIQKTGHTFGVEHPFEGPNDMLQEAVRTTLEFFELKRDYNEN